MIDGPTRAKWNEYLDAVSNAGGRNPIIGGGAVRDRLLGIVPNDVDIFYEGRLDYDAMATTFGAVVARDLSSVNNYDVPVDAIADVVTDDLETVQFMRVDSVPARLKRFAASISRAYYGSHVGLILTDAFLSSVETKTIHFDEWVSDAYRCKMINKFEPLGYTLKDR